MATNYTITNGAAITATITLTSLATASLSNARQGNFIDFGASRATTWVATLQTKPAVAPVAGTTVAVYLSFSMTTATTNNFPGGASGVDSAFNGADGNPATSLPRMDLIGVLSASATAVLQTKNVGMFTPYMQYAVPVVVDNLGQALSSVAGDHVLTFTPIQDQS